MANYIKLYDKQGIPVGFTECTEEVESALGDARVKLYDEQQRLVGFRVGSAAPRVTFSFTFPISVTALDGQTITFADITDLENLRLVTTGDDELQLVDGSIAENGDVYATYTIEGNVVTLHTTAPGGPTFKDYAWAN